MLKFMLLFSICVFALISEIVSTSNKSPCPTLKLKYGRVRTRQRGRFAKFQCNIGYLIAGEKYSTCQHGKWDSPLPKCVRNSCVKVTPPVNGLIYPSHRGAVLNFFCKPGYTLRGPTATYCDGRTWDTNLPTCTPTNTRPVTSCDFESEDLCGWSHDLRHDFDWRRMNFGTPSGHIGTGPSYDHTEGEGFDGYYMYIESSSRNENDTARLISPIFDKTTEDTCLEFYYHMYGATMGLLRVYLKKASDSWDLRASDAVFVKSGNQGNYWHQSFTQLGVIDEDFQIVIEGVRGRGYISDIAIDDVKIIENCHDFEISTTPTNLPYTEDNTLNIQSCQDRCFNDNFVTSQTSFQISCDCDETCIDKNTCCPDYAAICILATIDDFTTDVITTSVTLPPSTTIMTTKIADLPQKNKTISKDDNNVNSVLPKQDLNVSRAVNITYPNKMNITNVENTLRPIILLTTASTPEIVQKVLATTVPVRTSRKTGTQSVASPTTTKYTTETSTTEPVIHTTRKELYVWRKRTEAVQDLGRLFGTQNQKIVKERSTVDSKSVIAAVSAISSVILVIVCVIFVLRKYSLRGCTRINNMKNSGNGNSQSDVRFLTSDEILNFSLARPDDNDNNTNNFFTM